MAKSSYDDLPLEIWLEIFHYATYTPHCISRPDPFSPETAITNVMDYNTPFSSMRTKCNLVLVCRSWRRVAIEVLYEHVAITSPRRAKLVLGAFQGVSPPAEVTSNPDFSPNVNYGQWTRSIEVYTHARGGSSQSYLVDIYRILQCCPKVRMLRGRWTWVLPVAFLDSLAHLYGDGLKSLEWNEATLLSTSWAGPEFLANFQSLRVLDIRYITSCDFSDRLTKWNARLPHLTELLLSDTVPSLNVASALDIPDFHRLSIELVTTSPRHFDMRSNLIDVAIRWFLDTHGSKIAQLEILSNQSFTWNFVDARLFLRPGVCPNLVDLVLHDGHPDISLTEPHPSLRRIGLRGVCPDKLYPDKSTSVTRRLRSFMSGMFPALEVVRTVSYLVDSAVDTLARDIFIWWAERFERYGIDFQDGEGVLWMYTDPMSSAKNEWL